MLYTRVTSTKSLPPSSHPKKSTRQDKTQGEKSKSDVDSTTDNEGLKKTMLKRSTFFQKTFPFKFLNTLHIINFKAFEKSPFFQFIYP